MKFNAFKISQKTCEELRMLGRKSEGYESIIKDLLRHVKFCGRFWENRV